MSDQTSEGELQGVEVLRFRAEEACQSRITELVAAGAAGKLKSVKAHKLKLDDVLKVATSVTKATLNDRFLEADKIPAERTVFDTTTRRTPLTSAMAKLAVASFEPGAGRVFRDDGRNPWKILGFGFKHRSIAQDPGTVAKELRRVAQSTGIADWAHEYHQKNNSNGVPTISSAVLNEGSGASNSAWQYAIDLPTLSYSFDVQNLEEAVLGGPNKRGSENDNTKLLMDAATLGAAGIIAIQGGPMNEFTFLTEIKPEWVVGFRRLNFPTGEEWRVPIERPWRAADQADEIRALLEKADELRFPE